MDISKGKFLTSQYGGIFKVISEDPYLGIYHVSVQEPSVGCHGTGEYGVGTNMRISRDSHEHAYSDLVMQEIKVQPDQRPTHCQKVNSVDILRDDAMLTSQYGGLFKVASVCKDSYMVVVVKKPKVGIATTYAVGDFMEIRSKTNVHVFSNLTMQEIKEQPDQRPTLRQVAADAIDATSDYVQVQALTSKIEAMSAEKAVSDQLIYTLEKLLEKVTLELKNAQSMSESLQSACKLYEIIFEMQKRKDQMFPPITQPINPATLPWRVGDIQCAGDTQYAINTQVNWKFSDLLTASKDLDDLLNKAGQPFRSEN